MTMRQNHLPDDRLIDVCLHGASRRGDACVAPTEAEEQHLVSCPACEARRARLAQMLTDVSEFAAAQADTLFPSERLARQRARILQRIEQEVHHGRVITFPAGHSHAPLLRARPRMRWVAGAAAAGLLIGLTAGHLAHDLPRGASPASPLSTAEEPSIETLQFVAAPLTEEEFLGRIEMAVEGTAGSALRPLDDLTPRVWEVAAQ